MHLLLFASQRWRDRASRGVTSAGGSERVMATAHVGAAARAIRVAREARGASVAQLDTVSALRPFAVVAPLVAFCFGSACASRAAAAAAPCGTVRVIVETPSTNLVRKSRGNQNHQQEPTTSRLCRRARQSHRRKVRSAWRTWHHASEGRAALHE